MPTCSKGGHNQVSKQILKSFQSAKPEKKEARGFFRVSETSKCGRKLWFGRTGIVPTNPFKPATLVKMLVGDVLHNWIRAEYIPHNTDFTVTNWDEDKFKEEYLEGVFHDNATGADVYLGGHIDGIIRKGKKPIGVLEVKTAGKGSYFSSKKAQCQEETHWSYGYFKQVNDYIALWNISHPKEKVNQACIFLFNSSAEEDPDTGIPSRDWWFDYDKDLFLSRIHLRAVAQRQAEVDGLPHRAYDEPDDFECGGCLWKDHCWKEK